MNVKGKEVPLYYFSIIFPFLTANKIFSNFLYFPCFTLIFELKIFLFTEYNEDEGSEITDNDSECIKEDGEYSEREQGALIRDNYWYRWGHDVFNACRQHFKTESKNFNAFYIQEVNFTERLLNDISLLPIWSCIYCSHFGINRDPATSSPVENEFNKFKHAIMLDQGKQIRVDILVDNHLEYLIGKFKMIDSEMNLNQRKENEAEKIDETEDISDRIFDDGANNIDDSGNLGENQYVPDSEDSIGPPCCVCGTAIDENKILLCTKCGRNVHSIDCVDPYSDELVCMNCSLNKENLALGDMENWRGLVAKTTDRKRRKITFSKKPTHQASKTRTKNCAPCAAGYEMSEFNIQMRKYYKTPCNLFRFFSL